MKMKILALLLLLLTSLFAPSLLTAQNENNLTIDASSLVIPPYKHTPYSQVEPLYFSGRFFNTGTNPQTGTWIALSILDTVQQIIVHSDTIQYGLLEAGDTTEALTFATSFTPQDDREQSYLLTYQIGSDSVETEMLDNQFHYDFEISTSLFAKTLNPQLEIKLDTSLASVATAKTPGIATHYYINKAEDNWGTPLYATEATIGISNYEELEGLAMIVWLYEWTDINNDQVVQLDLASWEVEVAGFNTYTFSGDETSPFFVLPLIDFNVDPLEPCPPPPALQSETSYILATVVGLADFDQSLIVLGDSIPQLETTKAFYDQRGTPHYSHGYFSSNSNPPYYSLKSSIYPDTTNLGDAIVPYLFLGIGQQIIDAVDELSPDHLIEVYPNPATDQLYLNMEFSTPIEEANITLYNQQAQAIFKESYRNIFQQRVEWNVSALPSGIYTLHIQTSEGTRTKMITLF